MMLWKQHIIEALMHPQHGLFKKDLAKVLRFEDNLFTPAEEERRPPYVTTEAKFRFIKKYGTTEGEYRINFQKIMQVQNAINAIIKLDKGMGQYKKGHKMTIVADHPKFNHPISSLVESKIKARIFVDHVANNVSSTEEMNVTQTKFEYQGQ